MNVASRLSISDDDSAVPTVSVKRPVMKNTINAIAMAGIAVIMRYLICLKRSTPQAEEATIVVSLNGETLSPKYAPEIMAPAIQPSS